MELPPPAAGHPASRSGGRAHQGQGPVLSGVPAVPAAADRPAAPPGRGPRWLLIDEVDRADDEFEAFLFELLAESAVTIPELGTQRAVLPPVTVLTSNRTRDLHDALKRRCLYHWIAYPDTARVTEIIRRRVPAAGERLAGQVAAAVGRLRTLDLTKPPGISEALAWAFAVSVFGQQELAVPVANQTLSTVHEVPRGRRNGAPGRAGPGGRHHFVALARVTDEIAPGVVMAPMGAWRKNAKGHSTVNAVNPFVFADLGNAPTFSDTKVEVEPAEPAAS